MDHGFYQQAVSHGVGFIFGAEQDWRYWSPKINAQDCKIYRAVLLSEKLNTMYLQSGKFSF